MISIFNIGAAINIVITENITAIIMIYKLLTIPTAVIIASSENIASNTTICTTIIQKLVYPRFTWILFSLCSSLSCNSVTDLNIKNSPPNIKIKSHPENIIFITVINGLVNVTTQEIKDNNPILIINAILKPIKRARSRFCGVNNPAQDEGSVKNSMKLFR
uniref:Uncharacterized protein n=1 Tax=Glossina austeni TaxID=7395 RepID=A0A1A9UKN2_GLOAU